MNAYESWEQVAGYFDGDGNISISDLSNQPFKLSLSVIFTDASSEQISMIRTFFVNRGIRTSNILLTSKGTAHMVAISTYDGVLVALKAMLPYLFKKANEAQGVIDYYEGKIEETTLLLYSRTRSLPRDEKGTRAGSRSTFRSPLPRGIG